MKRLILVAVTVLLVPIIGLIYLSNTSSAGQTTQLKESRVQMNRADNSIISLPKTTENVSVPILMYHYVRDYDNVADPLGIQLSVSPLTFETQLQTLKKTGYESISLTQFAQGELPTKPIILTFDDGYSDHYNTVYPLLKKYGYSGTFFIVTGFVGRDGYMNQSQIHELKTAGMEIGGHSLTHRNLSTTPYETSIKEISRSLVGTVNVFAYPSGQYSWETLDIISGLGVAAAVTVEQGVANSESNLYELPRVRIKEGTDIPKKIKELEGVVPISKASQPPVDRIEYQE